MRTGLIAAAAAACLSGTAPGQVWFTGLPEGATQGTVTGLSQDGSVAVGGAVGVGVPVSAFRWTAAGGRDDFGLDPGMPTNTGAAAVSSDGSVIAGFFRASAQPNRAYRWTGSGPLQDLGVLPGETRMSASGISGDGSVVVGHGEHGEFTSFTGQAFRWTEQGGLEGLGYAHPHWIFSQAEAISRDGGTIVGWGKDGGGDGGAFVWTEDQGMQPLPGLSSSGWSAAQAVNADGRVIVGRSGTLAGQTHAALWSEEGVLDLDPIGAFLVSGAYAVSDDGQVVGGTAARSIGEGYRAMVWTPSTGMLFLSEYLATYDVAVPEGWTLLNVQAISGDGLSFAGQARDLSNNHLVGFVATVPAPGSLGVLFVSGVLCVRRRRGIR